MMLGDKIREEYHKKMKEIGIEESAETKAFFNKLKEIFGWEINKVFYFY